MQWQHSILPLTPAPSPTPSTSFHPLQFSVPCRRRTPSQSQLRVICRSLGSKWRIQNIDPDAVQEKLNTWFLKARTAVTEFAGPLINPGPGTPSGPPPDDENVALDEIVMKVPEVTLSGKTKNGVLSLEAIISIEQFSRMIGQTGEKMQKIFEAQAPESLRGNARSLVEYCCFRYLSRDNSHIHPCLKDSAFRRLIFITMLGWEKPYCEDTDEIYQLETLSLKGKFVGKEAFLRIAPAVAGLADIPTAHHLFKALVGDGEGISFSLWTAYVSELSKVHDNRESYKGYPNVQKPDEEILCLASSRKRPVLKWEENIAWPGNLTLTDHALYFERIGVGGQKEPIRLDLSAPGSRVEKTKVGPFDSKLFDSAISVTSGSGVQTWVLEFVDFGGEMRRDVWHAFISEIISLYEFIREFGPLGDDDPSIRHVYGARKGRIRAIKSVANSIARLQCLQFMRRLSEDPAKLVQFSYLRTVPFGDVVLQTLAVNFWGGPLITKQSQPNRSLPRNLEISPSASHIFDVDGSTYLHKWMKSPSWTQNLSVLFWKNTSVRGGIILSKNLVVSGLSSVERAALTCREKSQIVDRIRATIDAAMIQGIPSNIDLFKELMLPLVVAAASFEKLRRWEDPYMTISFLAFAYTVIFRNLLGYLLPMSLMIIAAALLLLRGLKEQGRLGRSFGKVTIRDQPPSNTLQKIIGLKEAMADLENRLQLLNVTLLKVRNIVLAGQPETTTEVALVLMGAAIVLFVVPFKYVISFVLLDLFTRELEFRQETVRQFRMFLKDRWAAVTASPVVVLPYEDPSTASPGDSPPKKKAQKPIQ
ncbi:chromosome-partitioning protein, putative (DUF639) [Wolffia australiana]